MPDAVGLELHGQTSLCGIATRAKTCKDHRFQDLYRMLDAGLLLQCWKEINKDSASGVDEVTAAEYGQELNGNIQNLVQRLKAKRYRAKLVRRVYIPKGEEEALVQWTKEVRRTAGQDGRAGQCHMEVSQKK